MDSKRVREIPNEHSAIYFKEIPAQLAEIKESLLRVTGSGLPGMTYKTLRDEIAIEVLRFLLAMPAEKFEKPTMSQVCNVAYLWADTMLKARESSSTESLTPTSNS